MDAMETWPVTHESMEPDSRTPDPLAADVADPWDAGSGGVDYEQLFVDQYKTIRSIVLFIGGRRRLTVHELEEVACHVNLKLIENDYGVFRKFEGRSSLRSYLSVVIQRLFLDWRVAQWGKWRPSAFAKRNGQVAMLLEQLTVCQGLSFEEAQTTLETVHRVTIGTRALEQLYAQLPTRSRRRYTGIEALRDVPAPFEDPMGGLMAEVESSEMAETSLALSSEVARLPPEERRLLKRRFVDGLTIRAIAATEGEDSKRLYRRLARLLVRLRMRLEKRGIQPSDVLRLLGRADVTLTAGWGLHEESHARPVVDTEIAFPSVPALVAASHQASGLEELAY
jgi:RNA polymerase sigma factor (sigma-70 family)